LKGLLQRDKEGMRAVVMNWCEACPKGKQKARDTDDVSESDDTKMSKAPQTKLVYTLLRS
jgi:minichromosome maintenance protein 10